MNNIDILEEYIKELNKNKKIAPSAYDTGFGKYWSDFGVAIEALIAENKELKEENTRLNVKIIDLYKYSIPKSKVKEKIKELQDKMNEDEVDEFGIHSIGWGCLDYVVEFLQSLLGKE